MSEDTTPPVTHPDGHPRIVVADFDLPYVRVSLTDIDIPFWRLATFIFKWTIASIPALLIIGSILWIVLTMLGGTVGPLAR